MAQGSPKIDELRARLQADPRSRMFVPLAEELRKAGQLSEAERVLLDGIGFHAGYLSAWVSLARVQMQQGNPRGAADAATRALKLDPENIVAARLCADAYMDLGEKVEAIKKYKLVLAFLPTDQDVQANVERLEREINPQKYTRHIELSEPAAQEEFQVFSAPADERFAEAETAPMPRMDAAAIQEATSSPHREQEFEFPADEPAAHSPPTPGWDDAQPQEPAQEPEAREGEQTYDAESLAPTADEESGRSPDLAAAARPEEAFPEGPAQGPAAGEWEQAAGTGSRAYQQVGEWPGVMPAENDVVAAADSLAPPAQHEWRAQEEEPAVTPLSAASEMPTLAAFIGESAFPESEEPPGIYDGDVEGSSPSYELGGRRDDEPDESVRELPEISAGAALSARLEIGSQAGDAGDETALANRETIERLEAWLSKIRDVENERD